MGLIAAGVSTYAKLEACPIPQAVAASKEALKALADAKVTEQKSLKVVAADCADLQSTRYPDDRDDSDSGGGGSGRALKTSTDSSTSSSSPHSSAPSTQIKSSHVQGGGRGPNQRKVLYMFASHHCMSDFLRVLQFSAMEPIAEHRLRVPFGDSSAVENCCKS